MFKKSHFLFKESSISPMSYSSSVESNQMLQGSEINPDISFNQAFDSVGQHKHTPKHGISNEISENFNKLAKAVNSKSNEYKNENTSDTTIESSSDGISKRQRISV